MQTTAQTGRAAYAPNSFTGADRGPRPDASKGFRTWPEPVQGELTRTRSETFADHYSQARQFWISQTEVEQQHIVDAYVFELSKCEIAAIRLRVVANLRNVDEDFASRIADGLGVPLPEASEPARPTRTDLPPSDALSMLKDPPGTFAGRMLGVLVTDGTDAALLEALTTAVEKAGGTVETVAPVIGGVSLSGGSEHTPTHLLKAAPSVLFDAVAIIPSTDGAAQLAKDPAARDFLNDALSHQKFIGLGEDVTALVAAVGGKDVLDEGTPTLTADTVGDFVGQLAQLRVWSRQP